MSSPYILWFNECDYKSLPRVGGKNASLGEMLKAGIRVPPGFAVTTEAYEAFLSRTGIKDKVYEELKGISSEDVDAIQRASNAIRRLIETTPPPSDVVEAIKEAYRKLCGGLGEIPVACRSSATAEDLPTASFAGQQETYLWVKGVDEVVNKVVKCWSSLFTPRAISYRIKMDFPHEKVLISVGVQKMVNAKAAGVMFTLNPLNGDPSKIVIEGSWGLGETVVSGQVTPDRFMVDKVTLEIIERTCNPKTVECVPSEEGEVKHVEVPPERQNVLCLTDEEVVELARLGKAIEKHYGRAQDIEWAIDKDYPFPENVFILQSRPETVWSQRKAEPVVKPKESPLEYIIDRLVTGTRLV